MRHLNASRRGIAVAVIQSGGVPVMMSLSLPQWVLELIAVHPRGHHRDERRNDRNAPGDREDGFGGWVITFPGRGLNSLAQHPGV